MDINLKVTGTYILDLQDDFLINEEAEFYEFLNGDCVSAFYLGMYIEEWFELLTKQQRYLYSKQIRHVIDGLEKYMDQVDFWCNKYAKPDEKIDIIALYEYVLNNMFWDPETEEDDIINLSFYLGQIVGKEKDKNVEKKDEITDIH